MNDQTKHFKVVAHGESFRLTHIPSGDYIQRDLRDFATRKDALACRDRVIAAAPDWDWSDVGFMTNIPNPIDRRVWAAIYADPKLQMWCPYAPKAGHNERHNWMPTCADTPYCREAE